MPRASRKDLLQVMDLLHDLYAYRNEDTFTDHLPSALLSFIPTSTCAYTYREWENPPYGLKEESLTTKHAPYDFPVRPDVVEIIYECSVREGSPLLEYACLDEQKLPLRSSDIWSRLKGSEFSKSLTFNEFYLPHKIPHIATIPIETSSVCFSDISYYRDGKDFSQYEMDLLTLLQPHVQQAFFNSHRVSTIEQGLRTYSDTIHALPQAIVAIGPSRKIAWATPRGQSLVKKYAGARTEAGDLLASPFREWVRHQDQLLDDPDTAPTGQLPLVLEGEGYRLTVRLIRQQDFRLLFFEEEPEEVPVDRLLSHGLTRRECEVMQWVMAGKTNPEIARILSVSVVTVEKHLGSVFQKFNIENRTAAVTTAIELMKQKTGFA